MTLLRSWLCVVGVLCHIVASQAVIDGTEYTVQFVQWSHVAGAARPKFRSCAECSISYWLESCLGAALPGGLCSGLSYHIQFVYHEM